MRYERLTKIENILKERERIIDQLQMDKKDLEKIKRDQEKSLETLQDERKFIAQVFQFFFNITKYSSLAQST